jgi:hypothetical protein
MHRNAPLAHGNEVEERTARDPRGMNADEAVPRERVPSGGLRQEARQECVLVGARGGRASGREGEEDGEAVRWTEVRKRAWHWSAREAELLPRRRERSDGARRGEARWH